MTQLADVGSVVETTRSIIDLNTAYTGSCALHSAFELGIFTHLANGPATLDSIVTGCALHPRLARDFLDSLVALGLLERDGDAYANAAGTEHHLVEGEGIFVGGGVHRAATHNFAMWGQLTQALRDGQAKSKVAGKNAFAQTYQNLDLARRFMEHMDANNAFVADEIARVYDWSQFRSFIDLGGARGNVAAGLVLAQPHLTGGVFDLPGVRPLFDEHMERLGMAENVLFHVGDFFADAYPATDVLLLGHVLHDWGPEQRQQLIQRCFDALAPGGALMVYDQMIDADRRDARKLLQSLNVGLVREHGGEYTVADITAWATAAGFTTTESFPLHTINHDVLFVARKAG